MNKPVNSTQRYNSDTRTLYKSSGPVGAVRAVLILACKDNSQSERTQIAFKFTVVYYHINILEGGL